MHYNSIIPSLRSCISLDLSFPSFAFSYFLHFPVFLSFFPLPSSLTIHIHLPKSVPNIYTPRTHPAHLNLPITRTFPLHRDLTNIHCNRSTELDNCTHETNVSQHSACPVCLYIHKMLHFMQIKRIEQDIKSPHVCVIART
jgi:hypothetical protein